MVRVIHAFQEIPHAYYAIWVRTTLQDQVAA